MTLLHSYFFGVIGVWGHFPMGVLRTTSTKTVMDCAIISRNELEDKTSIPGNIVAHILAFNWDMISGLIGPGLAWPTAAVH